MIIDSLKEFIQKNCPIIEGRKIKANYLGEKPASYSIEVVPCVPDIKKYADGGALRQYIFTFGSREYYDEEEIKNLNIAAMYEKIAEWFEEANKSKQLPELGEGLTALRFEILSSGYLYSNNGRTAQYRLQCRLIYNKERKF